MSNPPFPPQLPPPAYRTPENGLGNTSLILGIIGACFSFIPVVGIIAWPLTITGLVIGIVAVGKCSQRKADNKGVSIAGVVTSAFGLVICILWLVLFMRS